MNNIDFHRVPSMETSVVLADVYVPGEQASLVDDMMRFVSVMMR